MHFLVLEVEGLPDIDGGRRVFGLGPGMSANAVAKVMFHHHLHRCGGSPYLEPALRAIAAACLVECRDEVVRRVDLSLSNLDESQLVREIGRALERHRDSTFVYWDGGRGLAGWLAVRAMVGATLFRAPAAPSLEVALNLGGFAPDRRHLAGRLGIDAHDVPADDANWDAVQDQGLSPLVLRCATNATATALLWLRYAETTGMLIRQETAAIAGQLEALVPPRDVDAA